MARALANPESEPTYLDFFGMSRPPFARVSEPTQVFHAEQYSLLYSHLSGATEHSDHLVIVCGADGSGKTTLLNRYIASLGHEISFATVDEKSVDATQFYCELLRQLGFSDITGSLHELRHISREFLVHRGLARDPVLIMTDNAHLISPAVLEQLRWLSEIETKNGRVVSLVLSGNSDLTRIMASPAMSLVKFGNKVEFSIRVFSEQETDEYVRHRIRLAGGEDSANFTAQARPLIHRFSGGNPSLINTFCNALLTEALEQRTRVITEALVRKVADARKFVPHVLPLHGKGRRKTDSRIWPVAADSNIEERISVREGPPQGTLADFAAGCGQDDPSVDSLLAQISSLSEELEVTRDSAAKALLDIDARDVDINALLEKVAQQSKELERAARVARDNSDEVGGLAKALQDNSDEVEGLNKALQHSNDEIEDLKKTLRIRNDELEGLSKSLEDERDEIEGLNKALRDSGDEVDGLNSALHASQQQTDKLRDELKTAKATARKSATELRKLTQKLEKLELRKAELQTSLRDLKAEQKKNAAEVRRGAKAQDKKAASLEESIAGLRSDCDALRARAEEADRLEEDLASRDALVKELQGELESYVEEITATQVQLASDATGTNAIAPLADPDLYRGDIATIDIFKGGILDRFVILEPGQKRLMIGRGDDSELCLKSKFVSRHHALIFLAKKRAYVEDLRSFNGTIVNGKKISRCDLKPDDTVTIGDFELRPRRA